MYTIVKIETITSFLSYYNITYSSLSADSQALIVILANILFLIFWFIVAYVLYRLFLRFF